MNPEQFSDAAPGEQYDDEGYYAFRPDPLPPDIEIAGELAKELSEARGAIGKLSGIGHTVRNPHMLLRPFIRKEAVQSSQIEGTKATLSDLYAHEAGEESIIGARERDEVREVSNYVRAMEQGIQELEGSERQISLDLVRKLHETLMTGVRGEEKSPGQFRRSQNAIGAHDPRDARYVPPPPHHVSPAMRELEQFIQDGAGFDPLVEIGLAHYQFETIHPFLDGNGRVGRLIITLMLYQRGLLPQPFLYTSSYFNRHRDEYIDRLFSVSTGGEWEKWLVFFLTAITEQAEEAFIRSKKLLKLQEEYRERYQDARSETILRLVYELFENPFITVSRARERLDVAYPTANTAINTLVDDGVLEEITGKERYRVFRATEIYDVIDKPLEQITDDAETMLTEAEGADDMETRQSGLDYYTD